MRIERQAGSEHRALRDQSRKCRSQSIVTTPRVAKPEHKDSDCRRRPTDYPLMAVHTKSVLTQQFSFRAILPLVLESINLPSQSYNSTTSGICPSA